MAMESDLPERSIAEPGLRAAAGYARRALALVWRANPGLTLVIAGLTLIAAIAPPAATYIGKLIIDGVLAAIETQAAADRDAALVWVAVEAVVLGGLLVVRRVLAFQKSKLQVELGHAVSRAIQDKALAMDLAQIEDAGVQQQMQLARQHAASRPFNLVNRLLEGAQFAITLLAFIGLLWTFSPLLVLVMALGALPLFLGEVKFSTAMFRFQTGRAPEMRERAYLESLMTAEASAAERIHYGAGPQILARYERLFEDLYGRDRRLRGRRAYAGAALNALSSAVYLGAKIWVVLTAIGGAITLGQMTMLIAAVKQGQGALISLLGAFTGVYEDLLYISNLYAFLDGPEPAPRGRAAAGPTPGDGLRFEDVSFRYPAAPRPALDGVSLHIPPGIRLGIVGVNGSGKTTLIRLMTGLYAPQAGRVTLDGLDLRDWAPEALRARMAVMFQPYTRFKMTARDNIDMGEGLRNADDAALTAAAERGLAAELLQELPDGLETRLSRRFLDGRELSGGQWQRLALSRALLREAADIVILDEPTSAMDPAAEAEFMRRAAQRTGRTTVLVSHRLANMREADHIILMDAGRIAEEGPHDALMAAGGAYASLYAQQAEPYVRGRKDKRA
ncbi:MAG: ABC transporter ATP-binding protein [Maricaulaceae bacterium]|nr:ABC transporter ATP-binding protein [Maricaulaceae bacterium]